MIKVIIVEDDPMVAEFNKRYLELVEGFELRAVVHSATAALEMLDTCEADLLLLDIFMPGMNGLEMLTQIRRMGKGLDVIVVTAACDSQSIVTALRFGAVDYIIKPFEFERFYAALSAYRELAGLMRGRELIKQVELDSFVLCKDISPQLLLPKGVDKNTLKKVWEQIQSMQRSSFSTEEVAGLTGISRVSIRKYLEFLKQLGILKLELLYGTIGRPVYKYRCIYPGNQIIQRYLS